LNQASSENIISPFTIASRKGNPSSNLLLILSRTTIELSITIPDEIIIAESVIKFRLLPRKYRNRIENKRDVGIDIARIRLSLMLLKNINTTIVTAKTA